MSVGVGSNTITILVTAQDGNTTKTYTVTVTRAAAPSQSSDATLRGLTLSPTNISNFASGTTSYSVNVANSVSSVTVTPTANHASATITVNGTTVASGSGQAVSVNVGSNTITVEVTAEDGNTTKTYTVTVTRAAAAGASDDATLSELTLSGVPTLTPAFHADSTTYRATVGNGVLSTSVTAVTTHDKATRVIRIDGARDGDERVDLAVGTNVITVEVTAEDVRTTKTYTVTVTRAAAAGASDDATLSELTLSGVPALAPAFRTDYIAYRATVDNGVSATAVTALTTHEMASRVILIDDERDLDETVNLAVGDNTVKVEVTAEDGVTTQTYRVTVYRRYPPERAGPRVVVAASQVRGRPQGRGRTREATGSGTST